MIPTVPMDTIRPRRLPLVLRRNRYKPEISGSLRLGLSLYGPEPGRGTSDFSQIHTKLVPKISSQYLKNDMTDAE